MKIGVVGFGIMGRTHCNALQNTDGVELAAICEANPEVVTAEKDKAGNIDQQAGEINLSNITVYTDLEKMISEAELDAVSICLPTHLHQALTVKALDAGVHVLCEKPMSLTLEACDDMIAAAERSGKKLMIAQCIRFWPEYAWTKTAIDAGELGAVRQASFWRLSAAPGWGEGSWFADPAKSGGVTLDLHIHDIDYIQYLFGMPKSVTAEGAVTESGMLGHITSNFQYGDNKIVTAEASWMMSESFGFAMGFRIALEKATILFDPRQDLAFCVFPAEGEPFAPQVAAGDGYSQEIAHFAKLVAGEVQPVITPEEARGSVELALKVREKASC